MARSREQAALLIASGRIEVRGIRASKPATGVDADTPLRLTGDDVEYASRGGHKLAGGLDAAHGLARDSGRSHERPDRDARADRRTGRAHRGGPVVHIVAAGAAGAHR